MSNNATPTRIPHTCHVNSQDHANRQADIMFNGAMFQMGGSGMTIGNSGLRMNKTIYLDGLGARWNGKYYVWATTHSISSSGYTTSFTAQSDSFLTDFREAKSAQQSQKQDAPDYTAGFTPSTDGSGQAGVVKQKEPDQGT